MGGETLCALGGRGQKASPYIRVGAGLAVAVVAPQRPYFVRRRLTILLIVLLIGSPSFLGGAVCRSYPGIETDNSGWNAKREEVHALNQVRIMSWPEVVLPY